MMGLFYGFFKLKSSLVGGIFLYMYSFFLFPFTCYFVLSGKCILMEWEILSVSSTNMSLLVLLDPIGLSFSNVVCFISACVLIFSSYYMAADYFLSRFIWLVMMFVLSMNFLVFIPSLVSLLIGWDGLGVVSFALVIYYQSSKSLSAGMLTALVNRIGDVTLLLAIGFCVLQGHWNVMFMWETDLSVVVIFCILVAGMTKSAQVPFSSWLPAAMAAPTPVSALVHSSTLVTAGVFLFIRFFPFVSSFHGFCPSLLFVSVLTMLMAGIGANYEYDLKKVIALSTLSQLGVMMASLGLGAPYLALFHLYTHALFKAMLFLCAGGIIHNNSDVQDLRCLGGLWGQMPLSVACLNVANLALCGAPFLSGFYSKDLILESSLFSSCNLVMLLLIFLATGMTAAYSVRLSVYSLWGQSNHRPLHQNFDESGEATWPVVILALISVFVGKEMQGMFVEFNCSYVFPVSYKLLVVGVGLVGVWLSVMIWRSPVLREDRVGFNFLSGFFSWMWFLVPLCTQPVISGPLVAGGNFFKYLDQGWFEVGGGSGMLFMVKEGARGSEFFQQKLISFLVMMVVWSSVLILFWVVL
nr:NADH dehydrogenase subunit 5 [Haliotis sp. 1 KW-2022]UVI60515.1 NADH dehydrogenase subunit 5 [Haliotis sp. 1 KW-2022]UVI60528.1 NADH dehydrogenase subunit 5 [Haliotis sp. 1 KW-2022]